ncbi:uncharacterized protein LOC118564739 isoform X2 [Fundulus heteroclitus]|uniref:uncharacterized protein LOC118564739 isoform X2 n=1 Tax=Fundulus heteroclitus TaxID=8078 RepID=UPI00165C3123|nr:uncharacterized protein LOC118564739 isoform X2 [Fundulus heteroclitus]
MSSTQSLREFIRERLTAAAEEIFTEFDKTIVHYEEELDRQRRLLEICYKPQINLQRIVSCLQSRASVIDQLEARSTGGGSWKTQMSLKFSHSIIFGRRRRFPLNITSAAKRVTPVWTKKSHNLF